MRNRGGLYRWSRIWFALNGVVAIAPPLYWWADGRTTLIVGLPTALVYFLAVDSFIALTLVAAYLAEPRQDQPS